MVMEDINILRHNQASVIEHVLDKNGGVTYATKKEANTVLSYKCSDGPKKKTVYTYTRSIDDQQIQVREVREDSKVVESEKVTQLDDNELVQFENNWVSGWHPKIKESECFLDGKTPINLENTDIFEKPLTTGPQLEEATEDLKDDANDE